ncbi:MAG TPA: apolipoprotein N-acyltransferase [Candidatus Sericytochromatia bacterium]
MKTSKRLLQASQLLLPLSGGILMGLTPAPVEAWSLAWVALVPLWFLIARGESVRQSALNGLIWGIGYHGLALFWITGVHPMTWMGVPWLASLAIAFFCWTAITLCGAVLVATWCASLFWLLNFSPLQGVGKRAITRKPKTLALVRILMGTALWCGLEALWSAGPLWWSSLSYTQSPHNLIILHLGQLSGPATVTAAIVAVNGLLAEALISYLLSRSTRENLKEKSESLIYFSTAIGLLVTLHLIGFSLYSRPLIQPTVEALKVGIIQGNIGNNIKLFTEGKRRALEKYTNGYKKLADLGVDAVLTPEVALPFYLINLKQQSFYSAILDKGVVAWVGAYGQQGNSYTNSLFTITGTGEVFSEYDKAKLVPLGEYIPFEPILGKIVDRLSPINSHLAAGEPNQVFDTPFGRAIVGICYESTFARHFQRQGASGGQFILTASNNAHYSITMPAQHHAQDVMRAIETDRWAVRATNTGYSGIVDPHGRTVWISGINTDEIHADTIYRRQTQTLYVRWGDWLTPVLLGCAGLSWLVLKRLPKI